MIEGNHPYLDGNRSMHDTRCSRSIDGQSCSTESDTSDQATLVAQAKNGETTRPAVKTWASIAAEKVKQGQTLQIWRAAPAWRPEGTGNGTGQSKGDVVLRTGTQAAIGRRHDYIINHDWRSPSTDVPQVQRLSIGDNTTRSRFDHRPGPRTLGGCLYEDLQPGTIIWHWDIRPWDADRHDPEWIAFTDDNGQVMTQKGRYFVIVEKLKAEEGKLEVLEVAIYTNDNTGLEHIDGDKHHDYFSLCPSHIHVSRFENLSPSNPVLQINWMRHKRGEESKLDRKTMVVNSAKFRKTDIDIVDMRIVGTLDDASRDILVARALANRCSK